MGNKDRKEEEALMSRIDTYRAEFNASLKDNFSKEKDLRHQEGEVFFKSCWVPKDLLQTLQQEFSKRGKTIFIEIHLAIFGLFFLCILLWIVLKLFLLPD